MLCVVDLYSDRSAIHILRQEECQNCMWKNQCFYFSGHQTKSFQENKLIEFCVDEWVGDRRKISFINSKKNTSCWRSSVFDRLFSISYYIFLYFTETRDCILVLSSISSYCVSKNSRWIIGQDCLCCMNKLRKWLVIIKISEGWLCSSIFSMYYIELKRKKKRKAIVVF